MPAYRFGKHPARNDYRTLRFQDYVTAKLALPPASYDELQTRTYKNLKVKNASALFPMDGNDKLGDCTIAALAHAETVYCARVSQKKIMSTAEVEKVYMHLTGGVDSGLNELDVLNYWRQNKVSGNEIITFVKIDPKNHVHIQQAIQLFGGVYLGFQVQENCIQDFDKRKIWQPAKLTRDGHAVFAVAYDAKTVTVLTWGNTQQGSWAWWDECVDEAYAILPPQAKKKTYAGFDLAQLESDLNEVAMAV